MDFNNLTEENKADIKDLVNYHYGYSILNTVHSAIKDKVNLEVIIYRDETKESPIYIGINDFNDIYKDY